MGPVRIRVRYHAAGGRTAGPGVMPQGAPVTCMFEREGAGRQREECPIVAGHAAFLSEGSLVGFEQLGSPPFEQCSNRPLGHP